VRYELLSDLFREVSLKDKLRILSAEFGEPLVRKELSHMIRDHHREIQRTHKLIEKLEKIQALARWRLPW
jgi:hypothetical protein